MPLPASQCDGIWYLSFWRKNLIVSSTLQHIKPQHNAEVFFFIHICPLSKCINAMFAFTSAACMHRAQKMSPIQMECQWMFFIGARQRGQNNTATSRWPVLSVSLELVRNAAQLRRMSSSVLFRSLVFLLTAPEKCKWFTHYYKRYSRK